MYQERLDDVYGNGIVKETSMPDSNDIARIVDKIGYKKEWINKTKNHPEIIQTWKKELNDQGFNIGTINQAINIVSLLAKRISNTCTCDVDPYEYDRGSDDDDASENDDTQHSQPRIRLTADQMSANCKQANHIRMRIDQFIEYKKMPSDLHLLVKNKLNEYASKLTSQDWHPWSKNQVLDIIHPSLYCYVKGISKLVTGSNTITDKDYNEATRYQWLPANVTINRSDGGSVQTTFDSYINNLDETLHEDTYDVIGKAFSHFGKSVV